MKPTAGRNIPYTFPAAKFRNAIQFVFEMAAPPAPADQLYFHFEPTLTSTGPTDGEQVPFDPADIMTSTVADPIQVPCDVTYTTGSEVPTPFGTVVPDRLTVLLLDVDYAKVADCAFVTMGGDRYNRLYEPPSFGLFDVGLHEITFTAQNEN